MARKHVLIRSEARETVLHGGLALADAVRVTLGPKSKCVLTEKKWGRPIVCHDGVTIAKELELKLLTEATLTEIPELISEPAPATEMMS